jgi:hypothetical protein
LTVFSGLRRPGRDIVAATRIPLRVTKTLATRPSPELDGSDDISPIAECKNKMRTFVNYFFWKSEIVVFRGSSQSLALRFCVCGKSARLKLFEVGGPPER